MAFQPQNLKAMQRASVRVMEVAGTLTEKDWEKTQIKTFTKWCNLYLMKRDMAIDNIGYDFADGIKLINLLEVISNKKLGKYNKTPKMKIHQIANLNVAHEFISAFYAEVGIKVVPSPESLNEGDLRSILGLIWVLILRFSIADIDEGGLAAKEGLLLWCQRNTAGYDGVDPPGIQNFHTSWMNGLGFGALINKFRPDLLDYDALDKSNPKECMRVAFEVAQEKLGIPPLLDPEDIADVAKPDEKSLMTYLAEYWKVFSADTKVYLATKRLHRAIARRLVNQTMRDEYNASAQKLAGEIEAEIAVLEAKNLGGSFEDLRNNYFDLESYKTSTKPTLMSHKLKVRAELDTLQNKLESEKFPRYAAPQELSMEHVEARFAHLCSLEAPYEEELTSTLKTLFQETFAHFDGDSTNSLSKEELQACFSALSLELTPLEEEKLFGQEESLHFDKFLGFMMEKIVDSSNSEQIREACKIVSRDNAYVRASDLKQHLGGEQFAWVMQGNCQANVDEDGDYIDLDKLTEALFSPL